MTAWHTLEAAEVLRRLSTDPAQGLAETETGRRLAEHDGLWGRRDGKMVVAAAGRSPLAEVDLPGVMVVAEEFGGVRPQRITTLTDRKESRLR